MIGRRPWLKIVIPYAVALLLFVFSWTAHAVEEPDPGDSGTFSPAGTGPDGSSRLAALLAERGIPVERVTSSLDAIRSASQGGATVFLPAPDLPNPNLVRLLATLPADNRVVLVEPGPRHQSGLPVAGSMQRWATRVAAPGCTEPVAAEAGRASATRTRYVTEDPAYRCYGGGLVGQRWRNIELVLVGASDPFRNSRFEEHGNARLATGLLSTKDRVVWLDLHRPEPVSYSVVEAGRLGIDLPDADEQPIGGGGGAGRSPIWTAVPQAFWPILVLLALVGGLLALWRGRRLGPPVVEPLPVVVPSVETVTGRARLYERTDARGPAAAALRTAALRRIRRLLDLPAEAAEADVVAAVAALARAPVDHVRYLLYGPEPLDDGQLVAFARGLDALVDTVTHERKATQ